LQYLGSFSCVCTPCGITCLENMQFWRFRSYAETIYICEDNETTILLYNLKQRLKTDCILILDVK
jgi:hypothetical protein